MTKRETKTEVRQRAYDKQWEVVAKISTVRAGLTNKERVKDGTAVDLRAWITIHVTNSRRKAKNWLDINHVKVVLLGIPYEVSRVS